MQRRMSQRIENAQQDQARRPNQREDHGQPTQYLLREGLILGQASAMA